MTEMHLRDPIVGTYSACGPFTKNKQRIQRFLETGDTNYIYRNELNKACFQHDMAYGDFKDLKRRTQSGKVLKNKAFAIASNQKYDGYHKSTTDFVEKAKYEKDGADLEKKISDVNKKIPDVSRLKS